MYFAGQTGKSAAEAKSLIFPSSSNDDDILFCCLQLKEKQENSQILLISNDKNMRNKAHVNQVITYSKDEFSQKLKQDSQGLDTTYLSKYILPPYSDK